MQRADVKSVAGSTSKNSCGCAAGFTVVLAREGDYAEFKTVLSRGRHPAFIGRDLFERNARNGGALFYRFDTTNNVAVSLINARSGILIALNVVPQHRGHGLGGAILRFLVPNFARVVESKVPWFEANGYRAIGKLKQGISLRTQVMARAELFGLAGKIKAAFGSRITIKTK